MNYKPIVGISMGDAAGISPEIIVKTLNDLDTHDHVRPLVIGDARVIERELEINGINLMVHSINHVLDARFETNVMNVYDLSNLSSKDYKVGKVNEACGNAAVMYIRKSAELAVIGDIDAVASAPVNKKALNEAGHYFVGQTEIYAEYTNTEDFFTVLTGGKLRVYLLSSHVSLRTALEMIKQDRVEKVIRMANESLQDVFGIDKPKIAVAGLNPHASDGGLFGDEEIKEIIPVIRRLSEEGIHVAGPYPSDSLYYYAEKGHYDGIIGMYHDQGVIPLKKYGYVTVIVGTPIIRTTAGHGTAYDIAGKGIADHSNFQRALFLAGELANIKRKKNNMVKDL